MQASLDFAREQRDRFVEQLDHFLRIPSISTLPEYAPEIHRAADWLTVQLTRIGLENAHVFETVGHPIVYADWLHAAGAPTVLIYGHYDVQPVDPLDAWVTPPFEPSMRDGLLYARGSTDDKGQVMIHLAALESVMAADGQFPINIKLLIEGEEEIGSTSLDDFVPAQRTLLEADSILISDTTFLTAELPSIPYSLRGLAGAEIHVYGPKHDLHSGGYGGTVHNPAVALAEIIASLHDADGRVAIPGFYDQVRHLSPAEREVLAQVPYSVENWQQATGVEKPWGEPGYSLIERTGVRPTCEINGMWSGFQGKGGKTIIPAEAHAKITMRLVANQNPSEVLQLFTQYVMSIAPDDVVVQVEAAPDSAWPASTPIDSREIVTAHGIYQTVWGIAPVLAPGGGSIPVVATLQKELGVPVVLMGFGLPDSGVHAPNEHFSLEQFHKGIEAVIRYYYALAE
jgi:acetylornithine deacetylase/succinyl-diaminopimelate desuccinylase-like protein